MVRITQPIPSDTELSHRPITWITRKSEPGKVCYWQCFCGAEYDGDDAEQKWTEHQKQSAEKSS
jgi:hypothetical protein